MLVATLRCDLGCCSRTIVVIKAVPNTRPFLQEGGRASLGHLICVHTEVWRTGVCCRGMRLLRFALPFLLLFCAVLCLFIGLFVCVRLYTNELDVLRS